MPMLRRFFRGLADIVYPKTCPGCKNTIDKQTADKFICTSCQAKIKINRPPFCQKCGRHLETLNLKINICPGCLKSKLNFDRAFSPCIYEGVIKELIHEFKYKGKEHLYKPLSKIMIDFIKEYRLPIEYLDLIIPMPLHKTRLREREFNQAEALSKPIASEFNKTLASSLLIRHRLSRTQTELPTHKRFENVANSFSVTKNNDLINKNLLIIDDVFTTGATSSEAALALKEAGANKVLILTLAN